LYVVLRLNGVQKLAPIIGDGRKIRSELFPDRQGRPVRRFRLPSLNLTRERDSQFRVAVGQKNAIVGHGRRFIDQLFQQGDRLASGLFGGCELV
jgi:hypothetical protein